MANKGWKHKKTPIIIGNEKNPTKMESGQVIINKKATKKNLNKLININNDGLNSEKSKVSTDGTDGGILKGKPHYDSKGKSLGGIPVIVDGGKKIEVEGEEFVVNKEASQKHWKELSKINQSAGNGVPINPSDVGSDDDPQEFRKGGTAKIIFNPNHIPNKWIYSYAKKIKEKYPKVWDMGGNIFGNEAFKNLERVIKRGYWTDNEEWMYIKWQSYVARHHKDFRIAGTVAMLKWVDKTDKGWDYMKALIDKEVAKKYPKKGFKRKLSGGGGVGYLPKTFNSNENLYKEDLTYSLIKEFGNFGIYEYSEKISYTKKGNFNKGNQRFYKTISKYAIFEIENGNLKKVKSNISKKLDANEILKEVSKNKMSEGGGVNDKLAFIRKNENGNFWLYEINEKGNNYQEIDGSKSLSVVKDMANRWGYKLVSEKEFNNNYKLLEGGGELAKGIKVEAEHQNTFKKVYAHELNPKQAPIEIAKEHLKEDKNYYSKLAKTEKFDTGGTANTMEIGDIVRGEYFTGIYGNFRVVNLGANGIEVQNLLTGQKEVRQDFELMLFYKKGTNQVVPSSPVKSTNTGNKIPLSYVNSGGALNPSSKQIIKFEVGDIVRTRWDNWPQMQDYESPDNIATVTKKTLNADGEYEYDINSTTGNSKYTGRYLGKNLELAVERPVANNFKFEIGDEVIYKPTGEKAKVIDRSTNTGNNFYFIEFSGGFQLAKRKEADLEEIVTLERGQPAMPMPNAATVIKDELPKERKKFVTMDFQPFLQNWVTSNLTNAVNMDKKNIIEETVKDYIINVEAIDKNQNITFTKEAEILDKIDNYIN